jgi:hypothetical protein
LPEDDDVYGALQRAVHRRHVPGRESRPDGVLFKKLPEEVL